MYSTEVTRHIRAPRHRVYAALLDPDAVAQWRVPEGMRSEVHEFDPREGGRFRISLTYDAPDAVGKTASRTDTYHGNFVRLVQDQQVVEQSEFETADAALRGTMTMTTTLTEVDDGTQVVIRHDGIPDIVPRADNELGTRMSLDHLARLVTRPGAAATSTPG